MLGKLLYHLAPVRRGTVLSNLRRVFGEEAPAERIERLAQASYEHLARSAAEWLRVRWLSEARRRAMARVENLGALRAALDGGRGALILTGHLGNWEIAPLLMRASFRERGPWCHVLRRPIRPRWLERLLVGRFRDHGFGVLPKAESLPEILRLLRAGRAVAFVMDQHASRRDGVTVELFGHPATVFRSLAVVALRTGAPVLPFASWREPDGTHVLRFEEEVPPVREATFAGSVEASTQAYMRVLERLILAHPEQWLWMHRLWKGPRPERRGRPAETVP